MEEGLRLERELQVTQAYSKNVLGQQLEKNTKQLEDGLPPCKNLGVEANESSQMDSNCTVLLEPQ